MREIEPIMIDRTSLQLRGEELNALIWRERQWAVTTFGIEALDESCIIEAERLSKMQPTGGEDLPDWPSHMARKTWVDVDDFYTAFLLALAVFPQNAKLALEQIVEGVSSAVTRGRTSGGH